MVEVEVVVVVVVVVVVSWCNKRRDVEEQESKPSWYVMKGISRVGRLVPLTKPIAPSS
jgi:hypothetical protein